MIKYFKATSPRMNYSDYYAAYNLNDAEEEAYSVHGLPIKVEEVALSTIPRNNPTHPVKLECEDAEAVAARTVSIALHIIEYGINA